MKTIKIIDLLNKIANGEEAPRLIRIEGFNFRFISYVSVDCFYVEEETSKYWFDFMSIELNDDIEILDEEDEFEEVDELYNCCIESEDLNIEILRDNINCLSDKINKLKRNQKKIIERIKND
jgi:hypothetical protein